MFNILFWNNDTTRRPAACHGDLIEKFKNKPLIRPNALEFCGTPINLKQVKSDIFCLAGTNDHITPWVSCYKSAKLFGGKTEFVLSNSGHIQSILNPPGNPKARYITNPALPDDATRRQADANKPTDSWWRHRQACQAHRERQSAP